MPADPTSPLARRALTLMSALWALDHGLQTVSKRMLKRLGVSGPQRAALRLVAEEEGITPGQLARRLHHHPSTISTVTARLVAAGLLTRLDDADDGRRFHLRLTPRGRALSQDPTGTVEAAVHAMLTRVPPDDVAAARRVLDVLIEELERVE